VTVADIERRHELALLEQLLAESQRPVPPAPRPQQPHTPPMERQLADVLRLIATTFTTKRNAA
jgi:hypothetical protein